MTAALEDVKSIDIEEWLTLATAPSPTKLKQGQSPAMQNVWVDEKPGSVITAPGFIKVGTTPSNNPSPFCINFFRVSAGTQIFVVSDNATVWTTVDFQNFTAIITGLSSAFQLRGKVIRDKLWLTNGTDAVRVFDGTTTTVLDGTAGTPNVPKGRYIDYHDERVWLYHIAASRSQAAFSALTDSSANIIAPDNVSAWPTSNTLQISEGDADFGTGMLLYRGYLHFFKQYSIWRLVGYDEYTYTRVKTRASTGCRFNESIQILDSLVHLIGIDGIYVFDGEESERISDIIDPATASQTAFGFNQLQQPNTNNQFWEVAATSDWNAGTVPTNLSVDNELDLVAADNSLTDFNAGAVKTNIDVSTVSGSIQLDHTNTGHANQNVAINQTARIVVTGGGNVLGQGSYITDGNLSNTVGGLFGAGGGFAQFTISIPEANQISQIVLRNFKSSFGSAYSITDQSSAVMASGSLSANSGSDVTINIPSPSVASSITISLSGAGTASAPAVVTTTDIEVYLTAFYTNGVFTSKTLDLGDTPSSLGTFGALDSTGGVYTLSYFTQSSADGIVFDGGVSCTNGGAIGSTPKRYLRWGANFAGDGRSTPQIDAVYLPALYISAIHNTGGSIFAWGPFESVRSTLAQTINYYYRTATTSPGIAGATWNLIVPGGVLSDPVANQFVQFKIEISGGDSTHLPTVTSVTINWVVGVGGQPQTLQNVASAYWRNRYWLSAAGPGATANDTVLVRGKKTFGNPWMLKDWNLLSYTRYQDSLYAGSSLDGSIYQLDTGYSKAGSAMDSYFETGDFIFAGFYIDPKEVLIEVERKGSYSLNFGFSIDRGNTWTDISVDLTISTFAQSYVKKINIDGTNTDRIRFRVRTNEVDEPFEVHRMIFYYTLESARGSIK